MTSLIEQAALRLEQLRKAGVEVPGVASHRPESESVSQPIAAPAREEPRMPAAPVSQPVTIDLARVAAAGIAVPGGQRSQLTDQYRVIKRPLLRNATSRGSSMLTHGNLIMVTSALPAEGKTFTAVNLAMSIAAEMDHTVMLVDADVARASIPRVLGIDPGPGLLDVLDGSKELSSVLLRTNVEGLTVLRAGTHHPHATELLASDAMHQLLLQMATRYPERIILFDSPPLLLTTEARALASHMGQVIVVVHAAKTLQSQVESALAAIDTCPVRLLLLNQVIGAAEDNYGYAYGYGRGPETDAVPDSPATFTATGTGQPA